MISRDLTFVLGGARSGKSLHAEQLASASALPVTYVATARIGDDEFAARVARHRDVGPRSGPCSKRRSICRKRSRRSIGPSTVC
jgi:adenosyl cobinamide kinase/adenosyl cobinamide phosphate guanylyltransferase